MKGLLYDQLSQIKPSWMTGRRNPLLNSKVDDPFSFRTERVHLTSHSHPLPPFYFIYIYIKKKTSTITTIIYLTKRTNTTSFSSFTIFAASPPMADLQRNDNRQQPSRLQRRAPSSLQINRAVEWNVAIPLLSPLASSPPPQPLVTEQKPSQDTSQRHHRGTSEPEKVVVSFKNWQHPAAPFCYEPAPMVPPFVPV